MLTAELINSAENDRVSHAYLFADCGMALEFAEKLEAKAFDFVVIEPKDGKQRILTEDIEALRKELKYKSFGSRRVVLIKNADSMQAAAQNKLLKTLEEPLGNTVMILHADRPGAMLQTVRSRCIEVSGSEALPELSDNSVRMAELFYGKTQSGAEFYELKAVLLEILEDKESGREKAFAFLDAFENILREELVKTLDANALGRKIRLTEETRRRLISGFSTAYALKALTLDI